MGRGGIGGGPGPRRSLSLFFKFFRVRDFYIVFSRLFGLLFCSGRGIRILFSLGGSPVFLFVRLFRVWDLFGLFGCSGC